MKIARVFAVLFIVPLLISFTTVFVAPRVQAATVSETCGGDFFGLPKWYKYLPASAEDACNPSFPETTDAQGNKTTDVVKGVGLVIMAIFEMLVRIAGIIAVVFVIWGGFQFITSTGEPDKAAKARTTVLNALIGLVIAIVAAPVIGFIAKGIAG